MKSEDTISGFTSPTDYQFTLSGLLGRIETHRLLQDIRVEPFEDPDPKKEAKSKKISVPKLIKTKIPTREGYKARKEYWRS
jgi:hypothetical protein